MKDICTTNYDFESIKAAIVEKVKESKLYENPNASTINLIPEEKENDQKKEETPEQRKKRIGIPSHDVNELLKEMGLNTQIEKIEENEIDSELFWELGDGDLKEMLEVKIHGQRKRLLKRMEEIKKEHEGNMELKHKKEKKLNTEGI